MNLEVWTVFDPNSHFTERNLIKTDWNLTKWLLSMQAFWAVIESHTGSFDFFPSSWVSVHYCWSSQNGWVKVISRENATTWNFILVLRVVLRQLTKPLNLNKSIEICSQENILKIALDKFILQCNEQLDKYMNYTVSTFLRLWLLNLP